MLPRLGEVGKGGGGRGKGSGGGGGRLPSLELPPVSQWLLSTMSVAKHGPK